MADMTQGVLQQLLGSFDPAQRQQLLQQQQQAQQANQQVLEEPIPDIGPVQRMVSDYLTRYGSGRGGNAFNHMAAAVGTEAERTRQQKLAELARKQQAAENRAKDASEALTSHDAFTRYALSAARPGGALSREPSPEQLRTLYASLRNEAAQAAKSLDWTGSTGDDIQQWIEDYANRGMQVYMQQWSTQPLGPRGSVGNFGAPSVPGGGTIERRQLTDTLPTGTQSRPMQSSQQTGIPKFVLRPDELAPQDKRAVDQMTAAPGPDTERQMADMASRYGMLTQPQGEPNIGGLAQVQRPVRDEARASRGKVGAEGLGRADAQHYEDTMSAAQAAAQQFEAFNQLEKIDPRTNRFEPIYQNVGEVLGALGQDTNTPLIQNAIKTRQADIIINQLRNASLKLEKGVQTASDEKRIAAELPKTQDFAKVWQYSIKLGKEAAARRLEQAQFYQTATQADPRNLSTVQSEWSKRHRDDPLTQYLGGELIFRSDFLSAFKRKYPDATDDEARAEWLQLEQDYRRRGGRK